ncbi:MAG: hypothetical protein ACTSSP_00120 [Candidatus Asgardarchaeia archaeon]
MGFSRVIYLYCNGGSPDCEFYGREACQGDSPYTSAAEYKKDYQAAGWLFRPGNKAFCPVCRKDYGIRKSKNT